MKENANNQTKNIKKQPYKISEGIHRQNYHTILESNEDEENVQTMNQTNHVAYLKENFDKEIGDVKRYEGRVGEMPINKRTRGEVRENPARVKERVKVENEIPEVVRKELPPSTNVDYSNLNYSIDLGQTSDNLDGEMIQYAVKNSKKLSHDLNKNRSSHQIRNDLSSSCVTGSSDSQPLHVNINQNNKKINLNLPIEYNRINDAYHVEKTKKNNKKVALFTDRNVREATINGFNMDYRSLSNQLQEKREKLKMMNNLTKHNEKLYSRIEDFKKKVPLFIEKYLDNYQKHLENYKLMITLNDDEIDNLLDEYEERMENIKEKFKF